MDMDRKERRTVLFVTRSYTKIPTQVSSFESYMYVVTSDYLFD